MCMPMAIVIDRTSPAALRHPEKAHRPDAPVLRKPEWIRVKAPVSREYAETKAIVREHNLHTVCEEAGCPNIGECWSHRHATMMIMGDTCTRACAFCNVKTGLPGARYFASLRLLERAKELVPTGFTKSGLMVGLGESREEIMQVMDDLRAARVDFLTIGQYLQPSRKHAAVARFWPPEEFKALEAIARAKGFLMVSASPLTRSSYHADSDFAQMKAKRTSGR